jgi:hypothetical protein
MMMTDNFDRTMIDQRQEVLRDTRNRIMQSAKRMIYINFQKEGIHKYPAALEDPNLKTGDEYDVSFLGYPHRHIFHINVSIEVFHNDRDIEFIQFKRFCERLLSEGVVQLNYKSCEMISDDLYEQISSRYPERDVHISVSEDNENGCTIFYNTTKPYQQIKI